MSKIMLRRMLPLERHNDTKNPHERAVEFWISNKTGLRRSDESIWQLCRRAVAGKADYQVRKGFKYLSVLGELFGQVSFNVIPTIAGNSAICGLKISINRTFDANLHGSVVS